MEWTVWNARTVRPRQPAAKGQRVFVQPVSDGHFLMTRN